VPAGERPHLLLHRGEVADDQARHRGGGQVDEQGLDGGQGYGDEHGAAAGDQPGKGRGDGQARVGGRRPGRRIGVPPGCRDAIGGQPAQQRAAHQPEPYDAQPGTRTAPALSCHPGILPLEHVQTMR